MPAETHSHAGPLRPDDVERLVCERLAELLAIDDDDVTLDARLREDLDMDDYALLDLVETIEADLGEREIGLHLDDDELHDIVTVRDAIECVLARLAPDAAS
ncbi:MAG TPA: phosphopantetheine-binding protein [Acidimicrobiia bacterium]|nr:phosphopantetheine-binding protein [Acidimicrobiia bacterium]